MILIDNGEKVITLENLLLNSESIPIEMWGNANALNIERAIEYLKSVGGGSIKVPANEEYNLLIIRVMWGRNRHIVTPDMIVRYEYMNWRPPNNMKDENNNVIGEYRPYSTTPWQVGDIINNCDMEHSDDKAVYWYCVVSGTAEEPSGTWRYIQANIEADKRSILYDEGTETLTIL
jgi:hypothetical protein